MSMEMNKANECTCPSGDGSLVHPCPAHPVVEQAGGDERAKFEYWASDEGIYPKAVERSGNCYKLAQTQSYWMAWQARAALAQPSPLQSEQAEAERPEMSPERAAYFMRRFKSEEKLLGPNEQAAVDYVLSLLAQHDRIVGALRAERDGAIKLLGQSVWQKIERLTQERDAALARVEQQERTIAGMNEAHAKLAGLYEATQAQHSVPELLVRAEDFVSGKEVPQAWLDVQAERRRQVEAEGWTPEHDDLYCAAELPRAAAAYILNGANDEAPAIWPFSAKWWKPSTARRDMVKACALALAEIERLDRAAHGKEGNDD